MHGSKGSFVKYGLDKQEPQLIDGTYYQGKEEEVGIIHKENSEEVAIESAGYDSFFSLLADALTKRKPVVSMEEAINTIRIIELARISSEEGRVIKREEWKKY